MAQLSTSLRPALAQRAFGAVTAVLPHGASPRRPLQPAQLRQNTFRLPHRTDSRAAAGSENPDLGARGATTPRQPGPRLFGAGRGTIPAPNRRDAVRCARSRVRSRKGASRGSERRTTSPSHSLRGAPRTVRATPTRAPHGGRSRPDADPRPPPAATTRTRAPPPPTRPESVCSATRGSLYPPLQNASTTPESCGVGLRAPAQQTSIRPRARPPARMRVPILPTAFPSNAPTGDTGS